jgi:adenosylcobinamide-GDP ribazoletransferase
MSPPARLRHEARLLCVALQYFTRLPVPALQHFESSWLSQSVRYFPVAGWIVGAVGAGVLWLCAQALPLPVAALLALAATVAVTGAFHEDGLADTFDALGGHVPRDRALEIMRDSRIGTYGAAALGISLLLRWQAVTALPLAAAMVLLVCAHAAARAGAASLMASLPYVRLEADAKAKPVAQDLGTANLLATLLTGALPTLLCLAVFPHLAMALCAGVLAVAMVRIGCARWFRARLGGYTGDGLGCCEQFGEIAFLLAAMAASGATAA